MNTIDTASPLASDALERLAHKRAKMRLGWLTHAFVFVAVNLLLAPLFRQLMGLYPNIIKFK